MLDIDKSESLVYDTKNNRLYEADLDKNDRDDEFTLLDEKTGTKIYLTKVCYIVGICISVMSSSVSTRRRKSEFS
jgi:hypothetical protein